MDFLTYELENDIINNFRKTSDENNIISKIVQNNKNEIILNHLSCIFNNFKMYNRLILQKVFDKFVFFDDNYIII
tara:strand:- start:3672 stop:3896 length:225 start_codon:yes stop_codon:yes gene_type:complete